MIAFADAALLFLMGACAASLGAFTVVVARGRPAVAGAGVPPNLVPRTVECAVCTHRHVVRALRAQSLIGLQCPRCGELACDGEEAESV